MPFAFWCKQTYRRYRHSCLRSPCPWGRPCTSQDRTRQKAHVPWRQVSGVPPKTWLQKSHKSSPQAYSKWPWFKYFTQFVELTGRSCKFIGHLNCNMHLVNIFVMNCYTFSKIRICTMVKYFIAFCHFLSSNWIQKVFENMLKTANAFYLFRWFVWMVLPFCLKETSAKLMVVQKWATAGIKSQEHFLFLQPFRSPYFTYLK